MTGGKRLTRLTGKVSPVSEVSSRLRLSRPEKAGRVLDDGSAVLLNLIRNEGQKHRLPDQDLDDLTQDICVWLLRAGPPAQITRPWIRAVVRNFVLRFRRRSYRKALRERALTTEVPSRENRFTGEFSAIRMTLDEVSARLPGRERTILKLVRCGFSFPEAADRAGIPRGSRQYFRMRLLGRLRQELRPSTEPMRLPS